MVILKYSKSVNALTQLPINITMSIINNNNIYYHGFHKRSRYDQFYEQVAIMIN